jgi:N-sulfoglucosamine sulfohydrolase
LITMRNNTHSFLLLLLALLFSGGCTSTQKKAEEGERQENVPYYGMGLPSRPNIIWLVAEDMSPYLSSFGDSTVHTPHLDRLAREGVRYSNFYSVSGVCAPSRFSLATGMYTTSVGGHNMRTQYVKQHMDQLGLVLYEVVPPPAVKMMSEVMRRNGYYCSNNAKTDYQFAPPVTAWNESSLYAHWRNRPPGQPFFSVFNFDITHESRVDDPHPRRLYRFDKIVPHNSGKPQPDLEGNISRQEYRLHVPADLAVPVPPYLIDSETTRQDIRRVYSNIVEMDQQVGMLLNQLEEDGLLENTIIVWYTDHGGPLPRQKRLLYDSGLRVPMIIRFPGQPGAGQVDEQLVSFVDLAPAMFSLAGIPVPDYIQGQAFLGEQKANREREFIFAAADRLDTEYDMIRAVRDKRFKYLRNYHPDRPYYLPVTFREQKLPSMRDLLRHREEGKLNTYQAQWFRPGKPEEELFDCQADPHELHNLAADPAYAEKLKEMRTALAGWQRQYGDLGFVPEKELISRFWPGWQQPVTQAPQFSYTESKVTLQTQTDGASLGYQVLPAGMAPANREWQVYTGPVAVKPGEIVHAQAHRIGYKPSEVVEGMLP